MTRGPVRGYRGLVGGVKHSCGERRRRGTDSLYRTKNGGSIVAQVGVYVESATARSSNLILVGGLGVLLALVAVVGSSFDAIPQV